MHNARRVTVIVDDDHLETIGAVADALRARGMHVDEVLDQLGMINGTVPDVAGLVDIEGVGSIEPGHDVQLPPPDSPVQ